MRVYLPLTCDELAQATPPARPTFSPAPDTEGRLTEEAFEDALDDAAFASLELVSELGAAPLRVVAVAELGKGRTGVESWNQVESVMVDGEVGRQLIASLLGAEDQITADRLVQEIVEEPLIWFDSSERKHLADSHC